MSTNGGDLVAQLAETATDLAPALGLPDALPSPATVHDLLREIRYVQNVRGPVPA